MNSGSSSNNVTRRNKNRQRNTRPLEAIVEDYDSLLKDAVSLQQKMGGLYTDYYPDRGLINQLIDESIAMVRKGAAVSGRYYEANNAALQILGNYAKSSGVFTRKKNRVANGRKAMIEALYNQRKSVWNETYAQEYEEMEKKYKDLLQQIKAIETSTPKIRNTYRIHLQKRFYTVNTSKYNNRIPLASDLQKL